MLMHEAAGGGGGGGGWRHAPWHAPQEIRCSKIASDANFGPKPE